jgi:hypothetical protein
MINWRLLFDIVSREVGEIPPTPHQNQWVENSRDGLMIQSQSKLFKANQGFFGKNNLFFWGACRAVALAQAAVRKWWQRCSHRSRLVTGF